MQPQPAIRQLEMITRTVANFWHTFVAQRCSMQTNSMHLSNGAISTVLKFDNTFLLINNLKASVWVKFSNVTVIKPVHASTINLQHVIIKQDNNIYRLRSITTYKLQNAISDNCTSFEVCGTHTHMDLPYSPH